MIAGISTKAVTFKFLLKIFAKKFGFHFLLLPTFAFNCFAVRVFGVNASTTNQSIDLRRRLVVSFLFDGNFGL